jgi:hypothetical protein
MVNKFKYDDIMNSTLLNLMVESKKLYPNDILLLWEYIKQQFNLNFNSTRTIKQLKEHYNEIIDKKYIHYIPTNEIIEMIKYLKDIEKYTFKMISEHTNISQCTIKNYYYRKINVQTISSKDGIREE